MSLTDPIGDMIVRIKNAQMRNHKKVELPSSNFKVKIAEILKSEGFVIDYKVDLEDNKPILLINLKVFFPPPIIALFKILLFIPHNLFVSRLIFFGLIEISLHSFIFKSKISKSIFKDFFPSGPSMLSTLPLWTTLTFSGIDIFILQILDIKIPYKLFLHQLFVFLLLYRSLHLLVLI